MQDFEKLGVFYLGKTYDLATKQAKPDELVLYDSKDLVTHAVCVGMTGSGKTGLCLSLLEEAAIDSIPALVIDPKGDLADLLLTFPDLKPSDFEPWINEDDARKRGLSKNEFAKQQAEQWKNGLADWGQDGARIKRLRDAADFVIYTPGSNSGLPLSVIKSFAAPDSTIREEPELLREQIATTTSSLLGLIGIDADPLQSKEHILLSNIFQAAWTEGEDLDLPGLIQQIQEPPIKKVGVMELESFYPAQDRFGLAMQLNNLLGSPGFEAWTKGEPLNIDRLLHTPEGKPRIAIVSIAHLSDAERMFIVSLLLNHMLAWVRMQPGTTSLRALLYMDEIFGYFPPVANPPSKTPLLTLLKQARAFGVGVMLATQNPVDLDYKGLANAGTWFIGRLQTERDKARVLEGLEGAAAGFGQNFDRKRMEQTLAGLGNRIFLMNNVHENAPVVFQVRWAMSYLRGPLTRNQIKVLMDPRRPSEALAPVGRPAVPTSGATGLRPVLPPDVPQFFLPIETAFPVDGKLIYQPMLLGSGRIHYSDSKSGVEHDQDVVMVTPFGGGALAVDWKNGTVSDFTAEDLEKEPVNPAAPFVAPPPEAAKPKSYETWKKGLADTLYRTQRLEIFKSPGLKEFSEPEESEGDFRARLKHATHEQRDEMVQKLRDKYAAKIATLQDRIRRAEQAKQVQEEQASQSKFSTVISFGAAVIGAMLGRKRITAGTVGKATTAARNAGKSAKEASDVGRAEENVEALKQQLADLEAKCTAEVEKLSSDIDPTTEELETIAIKPKKTNVGISLVALVWAPCCQFADGKTQAAWK